MSILVTDSAGLVGASLALDWLLANGKPIVSLDKLCTGNLGLLGLESENRHAFSKGGHRWFNADYRVARTMPTRAAAIILTPEAHMSCLIHKSSEFSIC